MKASYRNKLLYEYKILQYTNISSLCSLYINFVDLYNISCSPNTIVEVMGRGGLSPWIMRQGLSRVPPP